MNWAKILNRNVWTICLVMILITTLILSAFNAWVLLTFFYAIVFLVGYFMVPFPIRQRFWIDLRKAVLLLFVVFMILGGIVCGIEGALTMNVFEFSGGMGSVISALLITMFVEIHQKITES